MSMYRCAACGSSNVAADTKMEGFSVGKGIAGTALFGSAGAVMGINGKSKLYYHCAVCGQTLTYTMPVVIKNAIDSYLNDPQSNIEMLEWEKKNYPNIEWKPEKEKNKEEAPISEDMEIEEIAEKIWNYYQKTKIPYISEAVLRESVCGRWYEPKWWDAVGLLEKRGLVTTEDEIANHEKPLSGNCK